MTCVILTIIVESQQTGQNPLPKTEVKLLRSKQGDSFFWYDKKNNQQPNFTGELH